MRQASSPEGSFAASSPAARRPVGNKPAAHQPTSQRAWGVLLLSSTQSNSWALDTAAPRPARSNSHLTCR